MTYKGMSSRLAIGHFEYHRPTYVCPTRINGAATRNRTPTQTLQRSCPAVRRQRLGCSARGLNPIMRTYEAREIPYLPPATYVVYGACKTYEVTYERPLTIGMW